MNGKAIKLQYFTVGLGSWITSIHQREQSQAGLGWAHISAQGTGGAVATKPWAEATKRAEGTNIHHLQHLRSPSRIGKTLQLLSASHWEIK